MSGIFCANFATSRAGWTACQSAWCPECYTPPNDVRFHHAKPQDEGGAVRVIIYSQHSNVTPVCSVTSRGGVLGKEIVFYWPAYARLIWTHCGDGRPLLSTALTELPNKPSKPLPRCRLSLPFHLLVLSLLMIVWLYYGHRNGFKVSGGGALH
jgi:hypothetical protein